jgi:hypothetical protein
VSLWKLPPEAKVYEAFSALADGRVHQAGPGRAEVVSSGGDRAYTVTWSGDRRALASDDNASRWQGYLGYPILAVLMDLGELPLDRAVVAPLAGVPWHELNRRFKRDYGAAVEHVLAGLEERGVGRAPIVAAADAVMARLSDLSLRRLGRRGA